MPSAVAAGSLYSLLWWICGSIAEFRERQGWSSLYSYKQADAPKHLLGRRHPEIPPVVGVSRVSQKQNL